MTDQDMLEAMKTLLEPISDRLSNITEKIEAIKPEQKMDERSIRKDIHCLTDKINTLIDALEAQETLSKAGIN